jgi:predicted nuclease of predicted toxin-antitoxin system
MNFVADESVDRQIVERLRDDGHSVWYVAEMAPSISDDEVLQIANNGSAPLITSDKDFGELVFRQHLVSYGVILIRLSGLSTELKANIVSSTTSNHENEILGNFTVISPSRIRIRKI